MAGKDFIHWHRLKSWLDNRASDTFFHEREVWLVSLGANVGHEEDGKDARFLRPVVILKKFNQDMFWGIPLSSTEKPYPYYYIFEMNGRRSSALLSQMRSIDRKRLFKKIAVVTEKDFDGVKKRIALLLNLITPESGQQKQIPSLGGDLQPTCRPPEAEASVTETPAPNASMNQS